MSVRPAKTQISLVAKDPGFLHADREDWSYWADAQADPSLRWAHIHFVGFVMSRLMWLYRRVMNPKDADGMANSVDADQTAPIWVHTVCPGLSVPKLRIIMVNFLYQRSHFTQSVGF